MSDDRLIEILRQERTDAICRVLGLEAKVSALQEAVREASHIMTSDIGLTDLSDWHERPEVAEALEKEAK